MVPKGVSLALLTFGSWWGTWRLLDREKGEVENEKEGSDFCVWGILLQYTLSTCVIHLPDKNNYHNT